MTGVNKSYGGYDYIIGTSTVDVDNKKHLTNKKFVVLYSKTYKNYRLTKKG